MTIRYPQIPPLPLAGTNMRTAESYLLCFDNADDITLLKDCLPRANNGTVIITSRDSVAIEEVANERVIVPEFSVIEGCEFLSSLLPDVDASLPENRAVLENISATFHGYPWLSLRVRVSSELVAARWTNT